MIAKVLAVCVALLFLGGAVQAADFHVGATATVELDEPANAVAAPLEPVVALVPIREVIVIATPPPSPPFTVALAPRLDRPPRP